MTSQQDPLASYRINKKEPYSRSEVPEITSKKTDDPLESYRIKKAEGFPLLYETGRHAARIGSRIAETIGGIPGDVSSLIQSGVMSGLEKLVGHKASPKAREEIKKQRLPTSAELKEFSQRHTKGLTKAQSPEEEFADQIAETATSLLGPIKFKRALGIAVGSQAAKEGIKIAGLEEGSQEAGKLGTMFLLSMINPGGALKYASSQYDKANKLAKGASITASNLESNLKNLQIDLQKGVETSAKNAVLKPINDILSKIQKGKIPVQELTSAKRDLNTIMKDPVLLKREKKLLKNVGHEIDKAIKPYEKINPEFKKAYRPANEIYGAVMQGNKASNFIKNTLGPKSVLGSIIAETALGHPEYILPTLGAGVGALGTAKGVELFTKLIKSPELRKFYSKAVASALAEDSIGLRKYSEKLEEKLEK